MQECDNMQGTKRTNKMAQKCILVLMQGIFFSLFEMYYLLMHKVTETRSVK